MSWQVLIWNMFIWTFTGVMIYIKNASLWWLIIPVLFTTTQNAAELYRKMSDAEKDEDDYELDPQTRKQLLDLVEKGERLKRGDYRRERI